MIRKLLEKHRRKKWVKTLPKKGRKTTKKLFTKYNYVTENKIIEDSKLLYDEIEGDIIPEQTVYANVIKTLYGGSDIFLGHFWQKNSLYGNVYKSINEPEFLLADTIVLVDDIVSSGDSLIRALNKIKDIIVKNNKKVIAASLFSTISAQNRIDKYIIENNLNMKSIYLYELKNAFEIGYIFKDKTPMISYNNMCDEIGLNDYRFGYNEDSTLLTFYYNTPNNTLGVFWSEENNHKPYFKRHIKRPSLMSLKHGSKKRKNQPQKFPTNDAHEYKKLLIAVYLCEKGLKNISQIKKKFGVNDSQLMDIVEELLKDDIIKIIESKCIMTKEGNDFIEKNTYEYVKSLYE